MTKARKRFSLILGILLVLVCLGLGGCWVFLDHYALAGEEWYERTIDTLDLSGQPIEDLDQMQAFPDLKQINLHNTGLTCEEYDQVRAWFPDADISWDIPFQGVYYDMETKNLTLTSLTDEDMALLPYFTGLKTVSAEDCPDYENLHTLRQQRSEVEFAYRVPIGEEWYSFDATELTLPGDEMEALFEMIPYLPNLEAVKLIPPLAPVERILELMEAFPQVYFSWDLKLGGISVNERTEKLDLTGIPMTVEEMDAVLPYLLNLTYVDMTDCGISNEEMDALNRRYENVKIVWTVTLGSWYRLRTDATWFMPVKYNYYPIAKELYNLRYCTDIIALDLGHMKITDCEFVAFMPHLKYLILAETLVHDLTPLTGLKELVYLELFILQIDDFSPLLTLTALEDLNLSYTKGDPYIIAQMTWLKNVWWYDVEYRQITYKEMQMLQEAIPECHFNFTSVSSTGGGWRTIPNYFAQRDIFDMHYMNG